MGKRVEDSDEIEGLRSEGLEKSVKLRKAVGWGCVGESEGGPRASLGPVA